MVRCTHGHPSSKCKDLVMWLLSGLGQPLINCSYGAKPNGRFIKAEATGWPDLQISTTNCIFAIIPHDQFISGRAKLFSAKAGPMAVLSTRNLMAVLSRQKQPDGQTSRFQHDQFISGQAILNKSRPNSRPDSQTPDLRRNQFISGRAKPFSAEASPMAVLSRPAQM